MASLDAANNKAELPNPQSDIIDRTNNARFWLEAVDDEAWKMQRDIAAGLYEHEEDIVTYIMNKYVRDYGGYDDDDHPITKDEIWDEDERKTKWFKKLQATWAGPDPGSRVGFEADKDVPLKEGVFDLFLSPFYLHNDRLLPWQGCHGRSVQSHFRRSRPGLETNPSKTQNWAERHERD